MPRARSAGNESEKQAAGPPGFTAELFSPTTSAAVGQRLLTPRASRRQRRAISRAASDFARSPKASRNLQ
ncbi:MAG: hypothetical protein DCC68_22725 [Planctomycetota bacterium]|nr:MAG: hypothetical protein DCC68_22725 [Planctomycetota bacterium]